jgi:hypothetical protein
MKKILEAIKKDFLKKPTNKELFVIMLLVIQSIAFTIAFWVNAC